jgi:hypothetical protein
VAAAWKSPTKPPAPELRPGDTMTLYMLALAGNDGRAVDAAHVASFGKARLLSISRPARAMTPAPALAATRPPVTRDPGALAALLLHTLDTQDGAGVVLADFDSEEFAADVVARMAALGRRVTWPGRTSRRTLRSIIRSRVSRS